jgi:NAD(P)-dependent dehydrogenase (short-subunit alcohol dehydrogenase family)
MLLLKVQYEVDSTVDAAGFTFDKMLHTTPDDAFDSIIKVHVRAPFRLVRQAAPYFRIKVRSHQTISSPHSNWLRAKTAKTDLLLTFRQLRVSMEMSDKPIMQQLSRL